MSELLAFEVDISGLVCVVFASSEKSARMKAVLAYWEAGYAYRQWPRGGISVSRVPCLDSSPLKGRRDERAWCPEYARNYP